MERRGGVGGGVRVAQVGKQLRERRMTAAPGAPKLQWQEQLGLMRRCGESQWLGPGWDVWLHWGNKKAAEGSGSKRGRVGGKWFFPVMGGGVLLHVFQCVLLGVCGYCGSMLGEVMLCCLLGGLPWSHLGACFMCAYGVVFFGCLCYDKLRSNVACLAYASHLGLY